MKVIELFNRDLNKSLTHDTNSVKAFRLQIDLLLKSVSERLFENEIAIIIGAGKMKDFSLAFFVKNFNQVILTDIDLKTVNEEVKELKLSNDELAKITKIRIDYTGFEKNQFFNDFKEKIINCHSYEKIDQVINSKLKGLDKYQFLEVYPATTDLVYVSPIYTQLVYNQILRECSILRETGYPEHMIKYIENTMLEKMVEVIERFNDNLVRILKPLGQLVVLSDVFQANIGSDFHLRVKNGIKNYEVMEEIYEGYKLKYGIGLGDYGLLNLDEKLTPYLSKWLLWPYDDKSVFVVKLKIYQKNSI
ncbi:MAG: hypothetical protein KAH16_05000 [Candidatus Izimaplasma sp.]|nr:hypothetical protein [Candidatus Izimaplasma bacterium]